VVDVEDVGDADDVEEGMGVVVDELDPPDGFGGLGGEVLAFPNAFENGKLGLQSLAARGRWVGDRGARSQRGSMEGIVCWTKWLGCLCTLVFGARFL